MPFTEKELREYLTDNFMNAPSTGHIEYDDNDSDNEIQTPQLKKPLVTGSTDVDMDVIFKYLEKDSLSLDIEHQRDYLKQYTIHLCLYDVIQTLRLPLIQYLLVNTNNVYRFPNTTLDMRPFMEINESKYGIVSSSEDSDEIKDTHLIDDEFLTQITAFFEKYTGLSMNTETMYKGFLEDEHNNIFVFIDTSSVTFTKDRSAEYAIIDEIINTGSIRDMMIEKTVTDIFKQYDFLHYLRTIEGIPVQFPKIGYICDENDKGEYVNVFESDSTSDNELLLPPSVDHEMYDNLYIFSAMPLSVSNVHLIRRFACFIENEEVDTPDLQQDNISFSENDIQYYGLYELDLFKEL